MRADSKQRKQASNLMTRIIWISFSGKSIFSHHFFVYTSWSNIQQSLEKRWGSWKVSLKLDRTFRNFWAPLSEDRRILCCSGTAYTDFEAPKLFKGRLGTCYGICISRVAISWMLWWRTAIPWSHFGSWWTAVSQEGHIFWKLPAFVQITKVAFMKPF